MNPGSCLVSAAKELERKTCPHEETRGKGETIAHDQTSNNSKTPPPSRHARPVALVSAPAPTSIPISQRCRFLTTVAVAGRRPQVTNYDPSPIPHFYLPDGPQVTLRWPSALEPCRHMWAYGMRQATSAGTISFGSLGSSPNLSPDGPGRRPPKGPLHSTALIIRQMRLSTIQGDRVGVARPSKYGPVFRHFEFLCYKPTPAPPLP